MPPDPALHWKVDECAGYFDRLHLRGWCFHAPERITALALQFDGTTTCHPLRSFGQPSPDVAGALDPAATHSRFDEWLDLPRELVGQPFSLRASLEDGRVVVGPDALTNCAAGDPYFQMWEDFILQLGQFEHGTVLEIGSRARSAITRRHRIPPHLQYVGLDVLDGPNVDVVGDAHELSRLFPGQRFVAAFSTSVFEHLAMPWKVAIELNAVLEPGGLVYTSSHQTWPAHEEPWDFWRFSRHSWRPLFNPATGFELTAATVGEPCRVHACRTSPVTASLSDSPAYLGSSCLARKIAATTLTWPVPSGVAAEAMYPAGELAEAPTRDRP